MVHRTTLLFCLVGMLGGWGTVVHAQDTIALYGDAGTGLQRYIDTPQDLETFDVIVMADLAHSGLWIEFKLPELTVLYPGVFKTATVFAGSNPEGFGHTEVGEYAFVFDFGELCVGPSSAEVLRLSYLDMNGLIESNVVIDIRPIEDEDLTLKSCLGVDLCYADCNSTQWMMTRRPWTDYDVIDPMWIPGTESSDGVLVLNPDAIAVTGSATSMGCLKTRF